MLGSSFHVALHDPDRDQCPHHLSHRPHDSLSILARWDPSFPSVPCFWHGILCSISSSPPCVIKLHLPHLHLSSPIFDRFAASLPFLQKISLHQNSFSDPILTSLSRLHSLFLQFNSLIGPLPRSLLTNLSDLHVFSITGNLFTGGIPTALPGSLHFLDLFFNILIDPLPDDLSATAPISNSSISASVATIAPCPPSLARFHSLLYLWLDWNCLKAPSPPSSPIAPSSSISTSSTMILKINSKFFIEI